MCSDWLPRDVPDGGCTYGRQLFRLAFTLMETEFIFSLQVNNRKESNLDCIYSTNGLTISASYV